MREFFVTAQAKTEEEIITLHQAILNELELNDSKYLIARTKEKINISIKAVFNVYPEKVIRSILECEEFKISSYEIHDAFFAEPEEFEGKVSSEFDQESNDGKDTNDFTIQEEQEDTDGRQLELQDFLNEETAVGYPNRGDSAEERTDLESSNEEQLAEETVASEVGKEEPEAEDEVSTSEEQQPDEDKISSKPPNEEQLTEETAAVEAEHEKSKEEVVVLDLHNGEQKEEKRRLCLPEELRKIVVNATSFDEDVHLLAAWFELGEKEGIFEAIIKVVLDMPKITWSNIIHAVNLQGVPMTNADRTIISKKTIEKLDEEKFLCRNLIKLLKILKEMYNKEESETVCEPFAENAMNAEGQSEDVLNTTGAETKDGIEAEAEDEKEEHKEAEAGDKTEESKEVNAEADAAEEHKEAELVAKAKKDEGAEPNDKEVAKEQVTTSTTTKHKERKQMPKNLMKCMPDIPEFAEMLANIDETKTIQEKVVEVLNALKYNKLEFKDKRHMQIMAEAALKTRGRIHIDELLDKARIPINDFTNCRYLFVKLIKDFVKEKTGEDCKIRLEDFLNDLKGAIG